MNPTETKAPRNITPEGQAAAGRIAAARTALNAGGTRQGATFVAPADSGVITPDSLKTPAPLKITPPPTDTSLAGMQGTLETAQGETDTFLQDLTKSTEAAQTGKTNALDQYLSSLMAPGETALKAEAYATENGVDTIQTELDAVNSKIQTEQNALRRRIERIQSSGGGLAGGAASEIENLERESLAKQADLYVIQMGVQGRFDSAKTIADRAVAAQVETQKQKQDILGILYQDNKDQFTKAEQREFEAKQAERDRKIQEEADNKTAIYELGIQAQMDGAPTSVIEQMMAAKTKEEALGIGGSYIGALDREAKRADIAQGWANLDLRQQEVNLSRERLNAELNANGNQYGTLDGKAQNATQSLVNGYANRLLESENVLAVVGDQFSAPTAFGGVLPSMLQTPERQQFEQAKRNFINAVLRRESGAVIAETEFANAEKQYFAQPGDSPEVLRQKENNRNTVINNFYAEANVPRPVFAGDIIESNGKRYRVESDGITITELP